MTRSIAWALVTLAWVGELAVPVAGQVSIRVVDASGQPIPAVRVDVIGRGESLGVASTSTAGVAELSNERWTEARRLSLSHLGFQTLIVQVEDIPDGGLIRMEPEAIPLDGLDVEVGQLCPVVDDPEARRLWSDVAMLYATDTGSRASFAYLSMHRGSVGEDELHRAIDLPTVEGVVNGGWGPPPGGGLASLTLDERIEQAGYAWPPFSIDGTTVRSNGWSYPDLDVGDAYHFASRVFGDAHDFTVMDASEEGTTLVFCGNGRLDGPSIDGSITLVPGRTFLRAEWRFETDDPDEGAGGAVTFASLAEPGSRPHLVSSGGLFYRHDGIEPPFPELPRTYVREIVTGVRWYLLPAGEPSPCVGNVLFPVSRGGPLAECVAERWGR